MTKLQGHFVHTLQIPKNARVCADLDDLYKPLVVGQEVVGLDCAQGGEP